MTTQSHNPDDDLSYYETTLPAVISGVRRGEKWEVSVGKRAWEPPVLNTLEYLSECIQEPGLIVRLAPVPVVKWWDSVEDFPLTAYWLRERDTGNIYRIEGCTAEGIVYSSRGNWPKLKEWDELKNHDWAPMIFSANWSPCVKPEGGK